jgi:hypothetical protein
MPHEASIIPQNRFHDRVDSNLAGLHQRNGVGHATGQHVSAVGT